MTHSRRTCLHAVFATVLVPVTLLAARFPDRGVPRQRAAAAIPDSLFKRAGIAKAKTPKACQDALDSAVSAGYSWVEADSKKRPADARDTASHSGYAAVAAHRKALSATCARKFKMATADSSDLRVLIGLYASAEMEDQLQSALERRIAMATTTEARAQALLDAVSRYVSYDTVPGRTARAEPYVARLDALGDSARKERIQAHATVASSLSFYNATDPLARAHADQALALVRALTPDERADSVHQGREDYVAGIQAAADVDAATGDYKTALAILNEGIATMGDTSRSYNVTQMLAAFRRYALVGTPAPAVTAEHWINAPAGTTTSTYAGRVTLLEFTTTWCGWCKKGYPAMRRLAAKYQSHGYQPMFVSLIEGASMSKSDTVSAELAYDRDHWVKGDSIGFPIAIYDTKVVVVPPPKKDSTSKKDLTAVASTKTSRDSTADSTAKAPPPRRESPTLFKEYLADGYPTYFFVDRNGIIRDVQVGHRVDIEQRFSTIIERLLAEPAAMR